MLLAAPLYVRIANLIGKVNIVSKPLYAFIVAFGNGILNGVIISSIVCLVIGILFFAVYKKLSKEKE